MDPIVFHAWRAPTMSVEEMPEMTEKATAEALRRRGFPVRTCLSECTVISAQAEFREIGTRPRSSAKKALSRLGHASSF